MSRNNKKQKFSRSKRKSKAKDQPKDQQSPKLTKKKKSTDNDDFPSTLALAQTVLGPLGSSSSSFSPTSPARKAPVRGSLGIPGPPKLKGDTRLSTVGYSSETDSESDNDSDDSGISSDSS